MNKKFEKEFEDFVTADPVFSKLSNSIVSKLIAIHFYNLALQNIKDDIINRRVHLSPNSIVNDDFAKTAKAIIKNYDSILDYIDTLNIKNEHSK